MRNDVLKKSIWKKRTVCEKAKRQNGITLIALIVTIVVLLILAGVCIAMLTGENGLLNKAQTVNEETLKQTASEKINLKITNVQMETYATKQKMPTLQDVADAFYLDKEIKYVITKNEVASTEIVKEKIDVTGYNSIYTMLEEYPYEFEIDSSLRLASINGVKVADNNLNSDNSELLERIETLETTISKLQSKVQELENTSSVGENIEKVETISTTIMNYNNKTLSYDFSKYKRVRCYAQEGSNCSIIFEIDLSNINNNCYDGVGMGHATKTDIPKNYIFTVNAFINVEKNLLTMNGIGYISGSTYSDRFTASTGGYCIYKIEGIY